MSFDTGADGEQTMTPENRIESMGMAIFAYQLGQIEFLDLIHQIGEMLGLPPFDPNSQQDKESAR